MVRLLAVLVLAGASVNAQTITETFGSGANQFSIEFVTIGNPGSAGHYNYELGFVNYAYNLGKYEISRDQVQKANLAGGLGITMEDMINYGGNGPSRPATGISWVEAAKFVNWLNTSQNFEAPYKFDSIGKLQFYSSGEAGFINANPLRNAASKYFLPNRNEWYKGAYGSVSGVWANYPTGSDSVPVPVTSGTNSLTAVYDQGFNRGEGARPVVGPADIDAAGGLSGFNTMGQGGNAWEWLENPAYLDLSGTTGFESYESFATTTWEVRGGSFYTPDAPLESVFLHGAPPLLELESFGFRIAMIPEASSLSLLLAGGAVALARRRKF